jgi:hypothetical protein
LFVCFQFAKRETGQAGMPVLQERKGRQANACFYDGETGQAGMPVLQERKGRQANACFYDGETGQAGMPVLLRARLRLSCPFSSADQLRVVA